MVPHEREPAGRKEVPRPPPGRTPRRVVGRAVARHATEGTPPRPGGGVVHVPYRSAEMGSTRVARRTGTSSATEAQASSVTAAAPSVIGSNGATP